MNIFMRLDKNIRLSLRIIVIDEPYRGQGFGSQFLFLMERWLKIQGYKTLHTEVSPNALPFYRKYAYIDMPLPVENLNDIEDE